MNSKELVLAAISFEDVPRVPVAVLDGHAWIGVQNNVSPQEMAMMDDAQAVDLLLGAYDKIGSDLVYTSAGHYGALHDAVMQACGGVDPAAPGADALEAVLNIDVQQVLDAVDAHPLTQSQRRRIELMNQRVGDEKLIMAFSSAPLTTATMLIGMEGLLVQLSEEPEVARKVIELGMEFSSYIVADEMAHGATAISMADPVSSAQVISEQAFQEFALPALRTACAGWRQFDCPVMLHICGDSMARLEDIRTLDLDIFSLDGGDLATELRVGRGSYTVFGNLSTVDVMMNATPQQVKAKAEELCQLAGLNGGFILAPGCDLAPGTPLDNVLAMTSAALGN